MAQVTGKGSIIALEKPERTCKRWQLRVSIGRDYITNKYITKTRRVSGTKSEAQRELRAFINELESGIRTDTQNLTIGEFAERWLLERELSGAIEEGTARRDDYRIRTICKHMGAIRLVDINTETISSFYIALRHGGSLENKPLSGTTIRGIAVTLKQILTEAVNRDIIIRNPSDRVAMPKRDTEEKKALSRAEARNLIALLTKDSLEARRMGVLLALTCGLRRQEVLGLRWGDFDKESGLLCITHALTADTGKLKKPKTKAGKRIIPLDTDTLKHLKDWHIVQEKELLKIGLSQDNKRPIITNKVGNFIHPENFSHWWIEFREKNNLGNISLHQLRHTFATLLVANGVDIVTAKTLMGHSDTKMLTELYAHVVPENVSKATDMIGNILYKEDVPAIEDAKKTNAFLDGRFVPDLYQRLS